MKRISILCIAALLLCTACRPTPEAPVVIGKTNDGWAEHAAEPTAAPLPYAAPERYENTLVYDDLSVEIDANINLPALTEYPVYILEPLLFTQEMADTIIPVLLCGAELYELPTAYTKGDIQRRIDYYTKELNAVGNEALTASYQEILADLFIELESAPESLDGIPASREMKFKEVSNSLVMQYGKRVDMQDGSFRFEWTQAGRAKAAANGNAAIDGLCTQENGRAMYLRMENLRYEDEGAWHNSLIFAKPDDAGDDWRFIDANFDEAEAVRRGDALIAEMGLGCERLSCALQKAVDGDAHYYVLRYRTRIPGTAGADFVAAPLGAQFDHYNAPLGQESLALMLDGGGIAGLYWENPVKVTQVDIESAKLLPWGSVAETIEAMLRVKNMWENAYDAENEYIVGRRLHIDSITLSYMQVRKDARLNQRYYIPVWDVCGKLYYKFSEAYAPHAVAGGGYLVDENHELDVFENDAYSALPVTFLTINAIDGSVIDRNTGY